MKLVFAIAGLVQSKSLLDAHDGTEMLNYDVSRMKMCKNIQLNAWGWPQGQMGALTSICSTSHPKTSKGESNLALCWNAALCGPKNEEKWYWVDGNSENVCVFWRSEKGTYCDDQMLTSIHEQMCTRNRAPIPQCCWRSSLSEVYPKQKSAASLLNAK